MFIDLLSSRVNDLLKLSERYRIGRLFRPIVSTIGLSGFHIIVLTLTTYIYYLTVHSADHRTLVLWKHVCPSVCHMPILNQGFYPRDAMLTRVIEIATCLSVCPSVRPSRVGILSKRRKLAA